MQVQHAPRYHWTVPEFEKLGKAGIFGEDDRVELLNGEIIVMSPIGYRHATAVTKLTNALVLRAKGRYLVSPQNPFLLDNRSEPQPDLCLIDPIVVEQSRHPEPADIFLVIEVADSTVHYDREEKLPAYARNGVREYWLLNLDKNHLEIYRRPEADQYREVWQRGPAESICLLAFPDVKLRVGDYLP